MESSLLELEYHKLLRHIDMLQQSNLQLKAALQESFDRDYKDALQDNIVVIARCRAQAAAMEKEMGVTPSSANGSAEAHGITADTNMPAAEAPGEAQAPTTSDQGSGSIVLSYKIWIQLDAFF